MGGRIQRFKTAFVIICATFLVACSSENPKNDTNLQQPIFKFQKYQIVSITSNKVRLNFLFTVENPNAIELDTLFMDYELFVKKQSYIKGLKTKLKRIPKASSTLSLPVTISYKQLKSSVASVAVLLARGKHDIPMSADIKIFGKLKLVELIPQDFKFQHSVKMLIPLPKYSVNDVQQFIQGVR